MTAPQIPGYTLETLLGRGAFGSVYRALWNEEFVCAVKVLEEGALHSGYLGQVLEQLLELPAHEGLLPVYAFDLAGEMPHVSMALLPENAVGLDDLAGQLTPAEAWAVLGQLAEALAWLHGHGLVHAGLTGGNVFVMAGDDGKPRALVADAGQAWLGEGVMDRLHDQAPYMPPERWLEPDRVLSDGLAETWDVYAFGVMAWRLLNGRWPRATRLFDRVLASKGEPLRIDAPAFGDWLRAEAPPVWSSRAVASGSPAAREMITRCLALDPAERPQSMMEVAGVLQECAAEIERQSRRSPSPFQVVGKPEGRPGREAGEEILPGDFNGTRNGQPHPGLHNGTGTHGRLTTPAGMPDWALAANHDPAVPPDDSHAFQAPPPPGHPDAALSPPPSPPPSPSPTAPLAEPAVNRWPDSWLAPATETAAPPAPPAPPANGHHAPDPPATPALATPAPAWPPVFEAEASLPLPTEEIDDLPQAVILPAESLPPVGSWMQPPPEQTAAPAFPAGWSAKPASGSGLENGVSFPDQAPAPPDKPPLAWHPDTFVKARPQTASVPVEGRPDFATLFSIPQAPSLSAPVAVRVPESESDPDGDSRGPEMLLSGADAPGPAPTVTSGTVSTVTVSQVSTAAPGMGRRLAVAAGILVGAGGIGYGLKQQNAAGEAQGKVSGISKELAELRTATVSASERLTALQENQAAAETARLSGRRMEWSAAVSEMLQRQPAGAGLREAWKTAAAPLTQPFKEAIEAADAEPALAQDGWKARWQMAEFQISLDQPSEALPWLEHVARDLDAETAAGRPLDEDAQLLKSRVAGRRGEILLQSGKAMEAAPLLTTASQLFEAWLATHAGQHDVEREYAQNSLREGQALIERKQSDEARSALSRVAGLLGKPGDEGFTPKDRFTLTDSLFGLASLHAAESKLDKAMELYIQSISLMVDYEVVDHGSIPCRQRMADGYFGLASLLAKTGSHGDASVAFTQAVNLLSELSKEEPAANLYRFKLALTYDAVALLISGARKTVAGAREALDYQNGSVLILRNLNEAVTLDNNYRRQLALALSLNGDLQELAGELNTAASRRTESLALLEELLAEPTLNETDRATCLAASGKTWSALAAQQEKDPDKKEAVASLGKAIDSWTALTGSDPAAAKEVETLRGRLAKLKPEG